MIYIKNIILVNIYIYYIIWGGFCRILGVAFVGVAYVWVAFVGGGGLLSVPPVDMTYTKTPSMADYYLFIRVAIFRSNYVKMRASETILICCCFHITICCKRYVFYRKEPENIDLSFL